MRTLYAEIDDFSEELLMNLAAQGYFAELLELINNLTDAFNQSLYTVSARGLGLELGDNRKV